MKLEEFKAKLDNLTDTGDFTFGFNWLDYVNKRLNEEIVAKHTANLRNLYDELDIRVGGKRVIDIGCGSGLSSLAFANLGCKVLKSIDVDPFSVDATKLAKTKFGAPETIEAWRIENSSILDTAKVEIAQYDIVYSWGVLHHTGDMWRAIKNAAAHTAPNGTFHVALYISGPRLQEHLAMKYLYKFLNRDAKIEYLHRWLFGEKGDRQVDIFSTDERGMNPYHDAVDWLGGLPYEVCDPEILAGYLKSEGYVQLYLSRPSSEGGNFTQVFKKTS